MAKNDFLVIGMGRFGQEVANQLVSMGKNVAVLDKDALVIDRMGKKYDFAITADSTDLETLKDIGAQFIPTILVAISDVNASVLTAAALRELGCTSIFIKARDNTHKRILNSMGLANIIMPEIEVAQRVALRAIFKMGADVSNVDDTHSIVKVSVTEHNITDKRLQDLNLRKSNDINILAVKRGQQTLTPTSDLILEVGDTVLFICDNKKIKASIKLFHKEVKAG